MIEQISDCEKFRSANLEGDLILHVIPVDEDKHSISTSPCILFIHNILLGETYYFSCDHPDSRPTISISQFVTDFLAPMKNKKWALDKKSFSQFIPSVNVRDINLLSYIHDNLTIKSDEYITSAHSLIRKNFRGLGVLNKSIPLVKHKEAFDELVGDLIPVITGYDIPSGFDSFDKYILETLGEVETFGICVDREKFKTCFEIDVGDKNITYSQYNVYTSTGRPSNRFGGVNYAALNQSDGSRKCFCSRFGDDGRMVLIDYTSFHPRIVSYLTKYNIPTDVDIYAYLAKLFFKKTEVDDIDIKEAKALTFRQLYGGVEDKYSHIKYLSNLKTFIDEQWAFFQTNGYVQTPFFKRRITNKHITDANPPKVFNYILQATEGELSIPKIKDVIGFLKTKHTKPVLYTYDAVLYDFHRNDGYETLKTIRDIMSFSGIFPMKTYIGTTYHDLKLVSI